MKRLLLLLLVFSFFAANTVYAQGTLSNEPAEDSGGLPINSLLYAIGIWLGSLAVLFALGYILSGVTLAAVNRSSGNTQIGGGERLLRSFYRLVILITSLAYYISLPFLALIVITMVGGAFYLMLEAGRIPVRIAIFLLLFGLYTLWALLRSLFIRIPDIEPGRRISRTEAPELWEVAEEVAAKVGTRPIDAIYMVPDTAIAVTERGGYLRQITGKTERALIFGLGAIEDMKTIHLKAILAHEYGHFSNRDTAGGGLALVVRNAIHSMARELAIRGQARPYNPAWLFINAYYRIYLRITLGASRLQEILADRYAALAYGSQNLADALQFVVKRSLAFDLQTNTEINVALKENRAFSSFYALPALEGDAQQAVEKKYAELAQRPTTHYDSHPSLKDRFAYLERVSTTSDEVDDSTTVDSILPNKSTFTEEMNNRIKKNVDAQLRQLQYLRQLQQQRGR